MKRTISQLRKWWTLVIFVALATQALAAKKPNLSTPSQACELYPIALSLSSVSNIATGTLLSNLRNGRESRQFGWLTWNGKESRSVLVASLTPPGNSSTYVNPLNKNDHELNVRDWVDATDADDTKTVRTALDKLKTRDIRVPVWYQSHSKNGYRVAGFALIRLVSYDLKNQDRITVRFLGFVSCDGAINQAPVVSAGPDQTIDHPANVTLSGSVTDDGLPTGAELRATWSKVSGPGTVAFANPNGATTTASFSTAGTYVLRLTGSDSQLSASDDVSVIVNDPNVAPVANAQSLNSSEDLAVTVTLTGSDADGDALTFTLLSNPSFGTLSGTAPNVVYQPTANVSGTDSFTFKVNDGLLDSAPATITINVAAVNDRPVAYGQSVSTDEDAPVAVALTGNDVEGTALVFTIVNPPAHGVLSGTPPNLTYTPVANWFGSDEFTFKVDDGALDSAPAVVTLTVRPLNDAPLALPGSASVNEDTSVYYLLHGSDVEGSPLTFSVVNQPAHGTLSGTPPHLTYIPTANYHGADSFTFVANDGSVNSAPATVTLTVNSVNDAPAAASQNVSTSEDTPVLVSMTATDMDGDSLSFVVVNLPAHGTLSGTLSDVTYTPDANYNGPDSFQFRANDGTADSQLATVTITVTAVNDAPVAAAQAVSTLEDTPVTLTLGGTDVENSALTFSVTGQPAHGTLSGTAPDLTYSPNANFNGSDSFAFTVNDGQADSAPATITITVTAVNDVPVATAQSVSTLEDTPVNLTLGGTDVENSPLTFTVTGQPVHGTLSGTAPDLTYSPNANFNGSDSFAFTVNDGEVDSAPATITITVTPVNDVPVATPQSVSTLEDTPVTFALGGTDVENSALTFTITSPPAHGTLTGTAPDVTYSPNANFNGTDSFAFTVNDGTADSQLATVTITVTAVNDVPVATAQSVSTLEDTPVTFALGGTDVENSALTFTVTSQPTHGTLSGTALDLTYSPNANFNGSDNFAFTVNDGQVDSAPALVSINVAPVNDVPVAQAQMVQAVELENTPITLAGSDVDNEPLTFEIVNGPTNGTLSGVAPNLSYTPNPEGRPEMDEFTFAVSDGVASSTVATVTIDIIYNQPPVVSAGPDRALRSTAEVITLGGVATDDGLPRNSSLQVAWQMKFGAGTVTFGDASSAVTTASFSANGLYLLELSASDSRYTSRDLVEVRVDMICSANPSGAVVWWPANGTPTDVLSGNDVVPEGGSDYAAGRVGAAFTFDGLDDRLTVAPSASLDLGAGNSFTIELWMNSRDVARSVRLLGWHSGLNVFSEDQGVNIFQSGGSLHAQIYDTNSVSHELVAFNSLANNAWTHVAVTYDRVTGLGRIYVNGGLKVTSNLGNFRPRTTYPLFFGNILPDATFFDGALDEVTLFARALDAQEIYEIFAANGTGKCLPGANQPPLVNAGPDVYLRDVSAVAALNGSATDDGLPAPASLRAAWSVVSAPGTVLFADSAALSTTARFDAPGNYILRLNVDDAAIVRSDIVEVRVATLCTIKNPPGLLAWWPANGAATDVMGGREGRLAGGTAFVTGRVGGAFSFDGSNDCVRVAGDSSLDVGAGNGFSIEFWMNSADVTRNGRLVAYHSGMGSGGLNMGVNVFQLSGNVHVQIPDPAGAAHEFVASSVLTNNTWTHVAVTYDRTRGFARLYINGGQRTLANVGSYLARTAGNVHFGNIPFDVNYYKGLLDEVSIYDRVIDAQEVFEVFAAGNVGKCPNDANLAPVVNAGPDLFVRDLAEVANLSGSVTDDGLPPGYGLQTVWTKVDGPGTVSFADGSAPVTTASFSAAGTYVLRLSADDGIVAASDMVEVRVASLCTVKDPPGLVAWWPANGNATEVVGGRNGRLAGGAGFASGRVAPAFRFDGVNDVVQVAAHPSLDVGVGNGLSLEFWINSTDVIRFARVVGWHFGVGTVATNFGVNIYQQSGSLSAQIYDTAGASHEMGAANSLVSNVWTHVAVTYDRATGQGRIFINGAMRTTANLGIYTPRTSYNMFFGNIPSDLGFFRGMLDEVSLYNRPLDVQEVFDIYNAGALGKCPKDNNQPPVVNAGPNLELAGASDVATLNGQATDDGLPPGAGLRLTWSKLDGPGTVTFADPAAAVTTASFSAPGIYVLRLAADDAAITRNDLVEVRVAVACASAPGGLVAWWPGNGSAQEVVGGLDGRLGGGTTFAGGRVSAAFSFDGTNDSVQVPAHANLDVGQGGGLTLEFWVNPVDTARNGRLLGWHSGLGTQATNVGVNVQMLGRTVNAQIYDLAGLPHDISAANALTSNTWTHVAVTYDRAAGQGRIYVNGVPRPPVAVGSYTARTSYRLFFGNLPFDPNHFRGLLDEISIYNRALGSNEVAALFAVGAAGKCPASAAAAPMFAQELSSPEPMATVTENDRGQRTAMSDASGTTTYTYDKQGRVSQVTKTWSAHAGAPAVETSLSYEYDELGRFAGVHSSHANGASMRYLWNDVNHLVEVADPHSGVTTYHYDAAGKAVSYTYPDNVTGSRFGVLRYEDDGTCVVDADGNPVRRTVTNGSRTVTTYYVVSPLTVTGAAQVMEELTFDSAEPLLAAPSVTRVYVHGLHTISQEELVDGVWKLTFFE